MELFENIKKDINSINENILEISNQTISRDEIELANKLNAIEEFTIDRFEGDTVVLENRKTNQMVDVDRNKLPKDIKEGDILKRINGKYFIDENGTKEVSDRIKNKMDNLWE